VNWLRREQSNWLLVMGFYGRYD